jgi:hypothetical protein
VALVAAIKDSMVILNFKHDGPIVLISKLSNLNLSPIEPIMSSAFLSIDVLKLDVLELSLEVVVNKWSDKVEMTLHSLVELNLLKGIMRVGVLLLVMMVIVVMIVAH